MNKGYSYAENFKYEPQGTIVYVLKNIKVYKLLTIESEVRRKIKKLNYRIKFVDINLSHKLETTNQ